MPYSAQIDSFLKKRGSPMAGLGSVFDAAGKKYGVDPRLVVAISGIESSFGKHTLGAHNAWGWGPGKPFASWEDGITQVTKGLRTGYLDRGLTTPDTIVHRYAPSSDGNDTGQWAKVVNQFLKQLGATVAPPKGTRRLTSVASAMPQSQQLPEHVPLQVAGLQQAALANLNSIAQGRFLKPTEQLAALAQGVVQDRQTTLQLQAAAAKDRQSVARDASPDTQVRGNAARPVPVKGMLQAPTHWQGTHVTDNLDWNHGKKTAEDIMAPAGTGVGAPEAGKIIRHGSAQGGQSLYFMGDSGTEYWLGHIDNLLPVGAVVAQGQRIASISADHPSPHLHIDRLLR